MSAECLRNIALLLNVQPAALFVAKISGRMLIGLICAEQKRKPPDMRKQKKFEFIGLRVEGDLKLQLEVLAAETGVTLSELIRMTLSKEVKKAA